MSKKTEQNIDLDALLSEVGAEIDTMIKSEKDKMEALKKSDSKLKKDDEGSGFEAPAPSPSPEASAAPEEAPAPEAEAAPEESQQEESLQSMIQGLDDEMLQELVQIVQMEMETRSKSQEPSAPEEAPSPSPEASAAPAPEMSKMDMYKSEVQGLKEKLNKSEEQSKNLEKAFTAMTELMEKMVSRPVVKAVTDIRSVDFIDKGGASLQKSEMSDQEIDSHLRKMASSSTELAKLDKNERDALSSYFATKRRTPEVLKLVSK